MDIHSIIVNEIEKVLDELSSTGSADGYMTPKAFGNKSKKSKKLRKDNAEQFGLKQIQTEAKSRYNQFKEDERPLKKKIGQAIKEINDTLTQLDHMLSMSARLKQDENVGSEDLWKRTSNHLSKIETRLLTMANKVRNLKS